MGEWKSNNVIWTYCIIKFKFEWIRERK
jgi:hypothetical protein